MANFFFARLQMVPEPWDGNIWDHRMFELHIVPSCVVLPLVGALMLVYIVAQHKTGMLSKL
jgi:hypothetical protein